jgi:two-component system, OmpR family, alkaline phosphatase synthesis response regulator PhoP
VTETPHRILVVDDEPDLLLLLQEHLTQEGFVVLTASAGMQAISMARSEQPDLILLDVMMPGVSGFDVCNILQDFPETREIPVIFLTAITETKRKVMGLNLGADDYVTKPFDLRELTARVLAAIRPRVVRQEVPVQ